MPIYTFKNKETGETFEKMMKIAEFVEYREAHPELETVITGAPSIGDPHRMGVVKPPDSFNSLLKHIKKGNSKGITKSTINTR